MKVATFLCVVDPDLQACLGIVARVGVFRLQRVEFGLLQGDVSRHLLILDVRAPAAQDRPAECRHTAVERRIPPFGDFRDDRGLARRQSGRDLFDELGAEAKVEKIAVTADQCAAGGSDKGSHRPAEHTDQTANQCAYRSAERTGICRFLERDLAIIALCHDRHAIDRETALGVQLSQRARCVVGLGLARQGNDNKFAHDHIPFRW